MFTRKMDFPCSRLRFARTGYGTKVWDLKLGFKTSPGVAQRVSSCACAKDEAVRSGAISHQVHRAIFMAAPRESNGANSASASSVSAWKHNSQNHGPFILWLAGFEQGQSGVEPLENYRRLTFVGGGISYVLAAILLSESPGRTRVYRHYFSHWKQTFVPRLSGIRHSSIGVRYTTPCPCI